MDQNQLYDICFCSSMDMLVHVAEVINNLVVVCPNVMFRVHLIIDCNEGQQIALAKKFSALSKNIEVVAYSGNILDNIILNKCILSNKQILLHDTKCIYYKLFIHRFVSNSISRILYLDYDVYIQDSKILDLFSEDIGRFYLAGAIDPLTNKENYVQTKLTGTYATKDYINTGVMMLNLDKLRGDVELDNQIVSFINNIPEEFLSSWYYDQTIINLFMHRKIKHVSYIYNFIINDYEHYLNLANKRIHKNIVSLMNDVAVFQYIENKPWDKRYDAQSFLHKYILKKYLANRQQVLRKIGDMLMSL